LPDSSVGLSPEDQAEYDAWFDEMMLEQNRMYEDNKFFGGTDFDPEDYDDGDQDF
jgi:hypothetical protein